MRSIARVAKAQIPDGLRYEQTVVKRFASSWNNGKMTALTLLKYEGLGNDFLVLVDREREVQYDAQLARVLCDRHHGIGADGLLRISNPRHGGDLFMELRNGDGSVAETSGNGMRCAVLAAFHE